MKSIIRTSVCANCGGDMVGDGVTRAITCENVDAWGITPDERPVHCDGDDETLALEGRAIALILEDILLERIEQEVIDARARLTIDQIQTLEELHAEREAEFVEWFDNYDGEGDLDGEEDDLEDEGDEDYFMPEAEIATEDHPAYIRALKDIEDLLDVPF